MSRTFAVLAVLLWTGLAWAAPAGKPEPFGFKGIELGSDIASVSGNPRFECHSSRAPGADAICSLRPKETETIAGVPVKSLFFFYYGARLTGITLHLEEKHFAQVVAALRAKYGETSVATETLRNLKGVAFENRTYAWKSAAESLTAQRYSGRLDHSSIRYAADDAIRRIEAHRADVARDPSKDL